MPRDTFQLRLPGRRVRPAVVPGVVGRGNYPIVTVPVADDPLPARPIHEDGQGAAPYGRHVRLLRSGIGRRPGLLSGLGRLVALGLLDADQRELLYLFLGEVDEHRRLVLRQVGDPGLVNRELSVADRPRRPLSLLVHGSADRGRLVSQGVVVLAPDHPVLVDGELEQIGGLLLTLADHREHAELLPLALLRVGLGFRADGGNVDRLLGVQVGRVPLFAVDDHRVARVHDRLAVVVVDRLGRVRAVPGEPGQRPPGDWPVGGAEPPGGEERVLLGEVPEVLADRVPLTADGGSRAVVGAGRPAGDGTAGGRRAVRPRPDRAAARAGNGLAAGSGRGTDAPARGDAALWPDGNPAVVGRPE